MWEQAKRRVLTDFVECAPAPGAPTSLDSGGAPAAGAQPATGSVAEQLEKQQAAAASEAARAAQAFDRRVQASLLPCKGPDIHAISGLGIRLRSIYL